MGNKDEPKPNIIENPEQKEAIISDEQILGLRSEIEKNIELPNLSDEQKNQIIRKVLSIFSEKQLHSEEPENNFPLTYINDVGPWLVENFRKKDENGQNLSPELYSEANLLFSASLFSYINQLQRQYGEQTAEEYTKSIKAQFFGISPNITSDVGGTAEQIQLLSLLKKCTISNWVFSKEIMGEIKLNNSFSNESNDFKELLENQINDPIEMLYLIDVESDLAKKAISSGEWSKPTAIKIIEAFESIENQTDTIPPLIRLYAHRKIEQLRYYSQMTEDVNLELMQKKDNSNQENFENFSDSLPKIDKNEFQYVDAKNMKFLKEINDNYFKGQSDLSEEYKITKPLVEKRLELVAQGYCGIFSIKTGEIESIIDKNGIETSIADWQPDNKLGLSQENMLLVQISNEPGLKSIIERDLGVRLEKIPFESQILFLRFMTEAKNNQYNSLIKELSEYESESNKIEFINAFLALEFGDEFGDRLLKIAEKLDNQKSLNIFHDINEIRRLSKSISESFKCSVDGLDFAMQVAWIKRTTELLAIIADEKSDEKEITSASEALDVMLYATNQIDDALSGDFIFDSTETGRTTYRSSTNNTLVTIRTSGATSQRIGFGMQIPKLLAGSNNKKGRGTNLSIRLDYDEYGLSLDIGTAWEAGKKVSPIASFIGEQMIKGEFAIYGKTIFGNHVREAFDNVKVNSDEDFNKVIDEFVSKLKIVSSASTVPDNKENAA